MRPPWPATPSDSRPALRPPPRPRREAAHREPPPPARVSPPVRGIVCAAPLGQAQLHLPGAVHPRLGPGHCRPARQVPKSIPHHRRHARPAGGRGGEACILRSGVHRLLPGPAGDAGRIRVGPTRVEQPPKGRGQGLGIVEIADPHRRPVQSHPITQADIRGELPSGRSSYQNTASSWPSRTWVSAGPSSSSRT